MMKLLKIYIVVLCVLLVNSCQHLQYKAPQHKHCRMLTNEVFCIDSATLEETTIPIEDTVGYSMYANEDWTSLNEFVNQVIIQNIRFSYCRDRACIRQVRDSFGGN